MTILSAQTIRHLCRAPVPEAERPAHEPPPFVHRPMIFPFHERTVAGGKTHGLSCCGYDVRLAQDLLLWPKCMHLGSTVERFAMPDYVKAGVHDKSSWARRGISVKNTVIEPGWRGYLTLEIVNDTWRFMRLRAGTPVAQLIFSMLDHPTEQPYRGKYQNQQNEPVPALDELDSVVIRGMSCGNVGVHR